MKFPNIFGWTRSEPTNSATTEVANLTLDSEQLRQELAAAATVDGMRVNDTSVMALPAAWRAVTILSHIVAGFPFDVIRRVDKKRENLPDNPIAYAMTRRANQFQSGFEFRRLMQTHLCLRGNAYARIVRPLRSSGKWEFLPFPLDSVTPRRSADGLRIEYELSGSRGGRNVLQAKDVLHLRGISLDGVVGLSPIQVARMNFAIALEGQRGAQKLLKQGSFAGYGLKHPAKLSAKALKNLSDSFAENFAGSENAGRPPVFEEGMEPVPLGFSATDAQFLEGRRFSLGDIARMFGVPSHMLNDTERNTSWGSGIAQQTQGFVDYTIMEWVRIWESAADYQLLDDEELSAKLQTAALLRGDPETRAKWYTAMRLIGVYNANRIREFEDEDPREDEGGEEYLTPSGAMLSPFADNPPKGNQNQGGNNEN